MTDNQQENNTIYIIVTVGPDKCVTWHKRNPSEFYWHTMSDVNHEIALLRALLPNINVRVLEVRPRPGYSELDTITALIDSWNRAIEQEST